MPSPCAPNVGGAGDDLNSQQADQLLLRAKNLAEARAQETGEPIDQALREITGELIAEEGTMTKVHERNALMTIQRKRAIKDYVRRFKTAGQGLLAFLQGGAKNIAGARLSVDYQAKATHGKYFGRLVAEMEDAGVLSKFKRADPEFTRLVYREMGATTPGQPAKSVTSNEAAFKIAQILEGVTAEMVARQNRAGAFIRRLPGYIVRQTHDQAAIRSVGGIGGTPETKARSFEEWWKFTRPLLNESKTFLGANPDTTARMIHDGLYSGIHGPPRDEANVMGVTVIGALANKVSQMRTLHFRDADSAFLYNQAFGIKDFKEQVLHDLHVRARSIALMESLGPSPEATLAQVTRELQEETRLGDDAAAQVDSLRDWRIQAAMNEITGRNEMSANPTLSNITGTTKVIAQMAKMGSVVLSSFSDRAFMQAEMAYQGISHLQTLGAQITSFAGRSKESKRMLRMMGVAMDGLMGNALARYSNHSTTSGWGHVAQRWFFDLNGLNLWTDTSKAAAAELMAANLGEHSSKAFLEMPNELRSVLSLYDITPSRWDAIRSQVVIREGQQYVLPDQLNVPTERFRSAAVQVGDKIYEGKAHYAIPLPEGVVLNEMGDVTRGNATSGFVTESGKFMSREEAGNIHSVDLKQVTISDLVRERGLKPTTANILRERDALETALRTYIADRVDYAIPTPGAAERKYSTFDTQAGTPLGEAIRMIMLFKSFPITVMRKILGREIYGRGADTLRDWLLHDHRGKFNLAMMMAMGTAMGYVSGTIKDALKGRAPKPLIDDDGSINVRNLNDAALRGGSLGIMGDVLLTEYDASYNGFLEHMAGPIVGQANALLDIKTRLSQGKNISQPAGKLLLDNAPMINLFYIRPVMDYLILWNLQEIMSPGSLRRMERAVERRTHQEHFIRPSEVVN